MNLTIKPLCQDNHSVEYDPAVPESPGGCVPADSHWTGSGWTTHGSITAAVTNGTAVKHRDGVATCMTNSDGLVTCIDDYYLPPPPPMSAEDKALIGLTFVLYCIGFFIVMGAGVMIFTNIRDAKNEPKVTEPTDSNPDPL